jgi:ribonuclease BN (tRNA processing enzyme)
MPKQHTTLVHHSRTARGLRLIYRYRATAIAGTALTGGLLLSGCNGVTPAEAATNRPTATTTDPFGEEPQQRDTAGVMAGHLARAFAFDTRVRVVDGRRDPAGGRLVAHEIRPGVVYERRGVRVVAFEVDHGLVRPAYGYRVEYGGRVAVLSGDTRFTERLIAAARGADLLVHEVVLARPDIGPSDSSYRAFAHHTTPEQAAAVFARVAPKLAVYSHVVVFGALDEAGILARTRPGYPGPVVLGQDLMSFRVGDSGPTPRPNAVSTPRRR